MSFTFVLGALITLTVAGFYLGRSRSLASAGGSAVRLHSRPHYYGYFVALWCGIPTLLILGVWTMFQTPIVEMIVQSNLPERMLEGDPAQMSLVMNDIRNFASGNITSGEITPAVQAAADQYTSLLQVSGLAKFVLILVVGIAAIAYARGKIDPALRARNQVEKTMMAILIVCSVIAILTTIGIVMSLVFESYRFFEKVSPVEFLFGLEWSPQTALRSDQVGASGAFGAIPLFVGGIALAWWVYPRAVDILTGFTPEGGSNFLDAQMFMTFTMRLFLAFGIAFVFPVVMVFLSWAGVVSPRTWLRGWRWAVIIIFTAAAVLTPTPDVFTMLMMAGPMSALYFGAIGVASLKGRIGKRRRA